MSVKIANNLKFYRRQAIILVEGSAGSKYEKAKENIINFMAEHIKGHFMDYQNKKGELLDLDLSYPLAVSLIEGYFCIYKIYDREDKIEEAIEKYTQLFLSGFINFI